MAKKAKASSSKKPRKNPLKPIGAFLKSKRFRRILGLFFILTSIYLVVAFTSFLITWEYDQDKVVGYGFFELLFSPEIRVENWLGKLGAVVSHQFMHNGFGVSSFLFVLFFFLLGFKSLTTISLIPLRKTFKLSFFFLIWLSIFFGFLFREDHLYMGGAFGYEINRYLITSLGSIGTGFLLFFTLIGFLAAHIKIDLQRFTAFFDKWLPGMAQRNENAERQNDRDEESEKEEESENDLFDSIHDTEDAQQENEEKEEEGSGVEMDVDESVQKEEEDQDDEDDDGFDIEIPEEEETTAKTEEENDDNLSLDVEEAAEEDTLSSKDVNKLVEDYGEYDPTLELSKFKMPTIDLLEDHGEEKITVNQEELEANKNKIVDTLKNYNIEISKIKATIGPTVTLYEIVPAPGVRISKIKNLEDDIALSLAALGIRIIAPIPGKGTIGIEVPNQNPKIVSMRTVIASEKFQKSDMALPIAFGKTITNETFVVDLAKTPHMLMAGATGQGKSVGLNAILVSLLYKKHPSQIKFVLVDPKKVELTLFNKIERHYLAKLPDEEEAIITDTSKVVQTLNSLCVEMDERYELLKEATARNIKEYNAKFIKRKLNPEKGHRYLPYIVVVVDEFADLIMTAGKEVEGPIARLAQLARAIGIHLIIATQRPSVNIITGVIKANFPTRVAFRVTSRIDSKTILDTGGADQLIGRGDMLISDGNKITRLQCAFVDTPEVEEICEYVGAQQGFPEAHELPEFSLDTGDGGGSPQDALEDRDALFEDAARVIVQNQQGSASLLQRRLKLGYNRAGRIIDQLEAAGIIGPFEGSKARQVLIPDEQSLEQLLKNEEE